MVAEKGFSFLKGPVRRLGLSDIPSPAGFTLEQYYYPDVKKITHVIKDMVAST
jgi:pyruvate dehydrogenase E1 component beta subunit